MATDGTVLDIRADGELLEQVDSFTYLGAIITANGDCGADIKAGQDWQRMYTIQINSHLE